MHEFLVFYRRFPHRCTPARGVYRHGQQPAVFTQTRTPPHEKKLLSPQFFIFGKSERRAAARCARPSWRGHATLQPHICKIPSLLPRVGRRFPRPRGVSLERYGDASCCCLGEETQQQLEKITPTGQICQTRRMMRERFERTDGRYRTERYGAAGEEGEHGYPRGGGGGGGRGVAARPKGASAGPALFVPWCLFDG